MPKRYTVGYRKPPKHTRFQKGRSGNPKGRPKGSRNFSTDVLETLKAPVQLTERGRARTVSTQLAALLRLREKALTGDARALDKLIELARIHNDEDLTTAAPTDLEPSDLQILERYANRLRRRANNDGVAQDHAPPNDKGAQEVKDDGEEL